MDGNKSFVKIFTFSDSDKFLAYDDWDWNATQTKIPIASYIFEFPPVYAGEFTATLITFACNTSYCNKNETCKTQPNNNNIICDPNDKFGDNTNWIIIGIISGTTSLTLLILCICACCCRRRARNGRRKNDLVVQRSRLKEMETELADARAKLSYQSSIVRAHEVVNESVEVEESHIHITSFFSDDPFEIPKEKLQIHTFAVLGRGEFGHVYKGILIKDAGTGASRVRVEGSAPETTFIKTTEEASSHEIVAVKVLSPTANAGSRESFRAEIALMKELGPHPHVLRLIGAVTTSAPLALVLEFASDGNLLSVLRQNRPADPDEAPQLSLKELYSFAWQVADGMDYIASKGFIHRDLAARNVLISSGLVAKVSDFGLSRHVKAHDSSYSFSTGRLPIKWMSVEALRDNLATTEGDVWAFGVLLWEIVSLGQAPYQLVAPGHMLEFLERGHRLAQPKGCPDAYYDLMRRCWDKSMEDRPSFGALKEALSEMLESKTSDEYNYLDLQAAQYSYFDMSEMKKDDNEDPQPPPRKANKREAGKAPMMARKMASNPDPESEAIGDKKATYAPTNMPPDSQKTPDMYSDAAAASDVESESIDVSPNDTH